MDSLLGAFYLWEPSVARIYPGNLRDCSTVTGADLRLARQESGKSTWEPVNDSEWATNSANGSISSLIVWTDLQPPGNVATVSSFPWISVDSVVDL